MRSTLLAALLLLPAALAGAAAQDLDGLVDAVNRAGAAPGTEAATVATIARAVGLAPAALRAAQAQAGLPWGDVFASHRLAARGGHSLEKVFAARRTGASWTEIAGDAKVDGALLAQDLAAAFPGLAPTAPRPAATPPPAPAPAPPPEKKPGLAQRFLDLFRGAPDREATEDWEAERAREEIRERILRGGGRR